ncbi:uncharacterized protein LTR77_002222 [Saxophila tyrrhenica]|uniref:Uncharacterized protein n=1 Tax=Saxophila tyrrhenica TaxID=1690608 RepID=A0AAV9PJQ3_9PEZI|nr:hypothetical protein LTR77_002222 [Saxophila tyrrhenica]
MLGERCLFRLLCRLHLAWRLSRTRPKPSDPVPCDPSFNFFGLPPELRNLIYEFMLADCPREYWLDSDQPYLIVPPILQCNHQISREAAGYYWRSGRFDFVVKFDEMAKFAQLSNFIGRDATKFLFAKSDVYIHLLLPRDNANYQDFKKHAVLGCLFGCGFGSTDATRKWHFVFQEVDVTNLAQYVITESSSGWRGSKAIAARYKAFPAEYLPLATQVYKQLENQLTKVGKEVMEHISTATGEGHLSPLLLSSSY